METTKACELIEGEGVKAPGAPAFSMIRDVSLANPGGAVIVKLDWGWMLYERDEIVETGHNCGRCGGTKQVSFVKNNKWYVRHCEECGEDA